MANIKPRYEVHTIPGKAMRTYCKVRVDDDGKNAGGFDTYEEEVDAGYMVYLPNGSSVHVWNEKELNLRGFGGPPALIDMDSGDEVGTMGTSALKSHSEQKGNSTKRVLKAGLQTEGANA